MSAAGLLTTAVCAAAIPAVVAAICWCENRWTPRPHIPPADPPPDLSDPVAWREIAVLEHIYRLESTP